VHQIPGKSSAVLTSSAAQKRAIKMGAFFQFTRLTTFLQAFKADTVGLVATVGANHCPPASYRPYGKASFPSPSARGDSGGPLSGHPSEAGPCHQAPELHEQRPVSGRQQATVIENQIPSIY